MNREEVEQQARRLIHLRREKESLSIQTEGSADDKACMIRKLPDRMRAEALEAAAVLLSRLAPGDEIRPSDVRELAFAAAADSVAALLDESLALADPGSHGAHDLAYLERRRAELEAEVAKLEGELAFAIEGSPAWPAGRVAIRPGSLEGFDSWSGVSLKAWSLEGWLQQIPAADPEPDETKRGPGRPRKISAGFRERESEEAPI